MYSASSKLTKIGITLPSNQKQFYREYLRSDHWGSLRKEKLGKNPCCEQCGKRELLDVHHKQYRNLYDVKIADLKTLCRSCHEQFHRKKKSKIQKKQQRQNRKWKKIKKKEDLIEYRTDNKTKRYAPDIYLEEYGIFLEIKGYWWGNDKQKMNLIFEQYPTFKRKCVIIEQPLFKILLMSKTTLEFIDKCNEYLNRIGNVGSCIHLEKVEKSVQLG